MGAYEPFHLSEEGISPSQTARIHLKISPLPLPHFSLWHALSLLHQASIFLFFPLTSLMLEMLDVGLIRTVSANT